MGDVLEMPDGSVFEIVRSPADPARDPSEIAFTVLPRGPAPPPHVHDHQRETFTLEEGDFELLLDGDWCALAPGESLTVEAGATHTFRNHGTRTARVRTVHDPGLSFEDYIRDLHATAIAHGSMGISPGMAVRMAVLWRTYAETIRPGPLPLRAALGVVGRVGPVVGLKPERAAR